MDFMRRIIQSKRKAPLIFYGRSFFYNKHFPLLTNIVWKCVVLFPLNINVMILNIKNNRLVGTVFFADLVKETGW